MKYIVYEAWLEFKEEIVADDLTESILNSMQIAFYGGASLILSQINKNATGNEEQDLLIIRDIHTEITEFVTQMKQKYPKA